MSNEAQSMLNASTDSVASANFITLHEKINANEERLNDINEQTKKKFQIIKENINQIRKKQKKNELIQRIILNKKIIV